MTVEAAMAWDPYADLPELYDLEHADVSDDIELYLRLAEVVGDPVLELGCGTGRVLLPLAAAGHRITGLDQSEAMLSRAEERLKGSGVRERATLDRGPMDAADHAPGGPFGLVLFSLNGLMHLATRSEQRAALIAARRALDPRGMLVVDLFNPDPALLSTFDGRVQHEGTWTADEGTRVDRFTSRVHMPSRQRIDTEIWFDLVSPGGSLRRVRTRFPMRYVYPSEFELMLEAAGYIEWKLYGSYELDPFEDGSERLIVTAEVTPS